MDCSPPGSSVRRTLQARTLDWIAVSSSRGSSRPRDDSVSLMFPVLAVGVFTTSTTWEIYNEILYIYLVAAAAAAAAKSLQSCPTLCNPIDGSPPGYPVPGILQARTLEWGAISFSNAWKWKVKVKSLSHLRLLMTPMDCSPPRSSVHGIFQARVLEWGAIAFSDIFG